MFRRRHAFLYLFIVFLLLLLPITSFSKGQKEIKNLTKAYEIWKNKGIKFAIRKKGKFITWGTGKLESWGGKSKWVVRDPKGHFLIYAIGKVEHWKNGQIRLVFRDKRGHLLTHIRINITSRASFASNVVGLRRLKKSKFLAFVQETIAETINKELDNGHLTKAKVIVTYLKKYYKRVGAANFKSVIRMVKQKVNYLLIHESNSKTENKLQKLLDGLKEVSKLL